ncbi:MAG TPA: hypothetical protein VJB92_01630 [Candidatus Paceibacterota bacterium]
MKRLQKPIALITLLVLLGTSMPISFNRERMRLEPLEAQATIPVIDPANLSTAIMSLFEFIYTEVIIPALVDTLRRRIFDVIVDQTISWIQGGGKPKFVTDWGGFAKDVGNEAVGDFAQELGLGFLCQPFHLQVQLALFPVRRFSQRATCTLDQIVGNIQNFYNDFRNGSWIGYTTSLEPQNNYFGITLMAYGELQKRRVDAEHDAETEALAGSGFLSTKNCQEDPNSASRDIDGDGKKGDISPCEITTPGDTIGNLVSKAVGSDIDYIINAEQLGAYVSAIANAAINRLITSGVNGLRGVSTRSAPRGGSIPPGSGNCPGLTGDALNACRQYNTGASGSFTIAKQNLIIQIDQSLLPREQAALSFNDSIQRLQNYASTVQGMIATLNTKNITTCPNRDTYIANMNSELSWASTTLQTVQAAQTANQTLVTQLKQAKTSVTGLQTNDWASFGNITTQLNGSGALDANAASVTQSGADSENTAVKDRINQNLPVFNQNVASCP